MNSVQIIGNLTTDPELHQFENSELCKLRLAVNGFKKDKSDTVFLDVNVWGKQAGPCKEHLYKGRPVGVVGRLALDKWDDKDGKARQKLFVTADNVEFLNKKEDGDMKAVHETRQPPRERQQESVVDRQTAPSESFDDSDVPF